MKALDFNKRRCTWVREFADLIQVLNVQESIRHEDIVYINVGVYIKELGDLKMPPENKCHVRRRAPHGEVSAMLDYALAWLDTRTTIIDLRKKTNDGDARELVHTKARGYLHGYQIDHWSTTRVAPGR